MERKNLSIRYEAGVITMTFGMKVLGKIENGK